MQRVPGKELMLDVRRQIDIGNLAAIRFEAALKASGRSPRFVRTRLSTSRLRSCEAAAIVGRRFTGVFAKGGSKRACLAKSHIKSNLRHRQLALRQQGFGPFDSPAGQVLVRWHTERLFECTRKMVGAELR